MDVARLDNNDDWLFVAYNAGIQVWDLRTDPKEPTRTRFRDGWQGHFFEFPHAGEVDTYVESLDAIDSGGDILLGVAGRNGHGFSLWEFTPPSTLTQHCQYTTPWARQVEMIQHTDGKAYAIVSDSTGVHVFDATASTGPGEACSYKGKVGDMVDGNYVTVLQKDGRVYIAATDGRSLPADPLALEIWRVDPTSPGGPPLGGSRKLFSGFNTNTRGPVLFEIPGNLGPGAHSTTGYFLGLIEQGKLKFYNVASCLGASTTSCTPVGPLAQETLSPATGGFQFVDVSTSGSGANRKVWAYYGLETTFLLGGKVEQLIDVTSLNSTTPSLYEMTDGADTYFNTNVCSNTSLAVDYWGDYYTNNLYGRNFLIPRHGLFINNLFYRAAYAMLDIHEYMPGGGGGSSQHITTTVDDNTLWAGDDGSFTGTAVGDCTPGNGSWCWTVLTEGVGGDAYTPSVTSGTCGDISPKSISFSCVPGAGKARCSEGGAVVEAWNTSCGSYPPPEDEVTAVQVTLKDPTVAIEGTIDTNGTSTYQQCQEVPLRVTLGGRGAATWQWFADGEALTGCNGSAPPDSDLSESVVACTWDTSGVRLENIFADGFESGDVSVWSISHGFPAPSMTTQIPRAVLPVDLTKASSRAINVELVVSNVGELDRESTTVTIETIGEPSFTGPVGTSVVGNSATLTAPAADTSTWTWEIEDPNPQGNDVSAACTFKPGAVCTTVTTGTADGGDTLQHSWVTDGTYEFKVTLSNCLPGANPSAMGSVSVSGAVTPNISSFRIMTGEASCCGVPNFEFKCVAGEPISMQVIMAEAAGSYSFGFDWERTSTASATYSTQSPSSSSSSTYNFEHTFSSAPSSRTVYPIVQVTSGLASDTQTYFTSGGAITILPAGSVCQ